jgi:hypothetical protein
MKEKRRFTRKNPSAAFLLHMETYTGHNGQEMIDQLTNADITRAAPDPRPCNFWLFGFLKESMKGMDLTTEDHIVEAVTTIWRSVTFETQRSVFQK